MKYYCFVFLTALAIGCADGPQDAAGGVLAKGIAPGAVTSEEELEYTHDAPNEDAPPVVLVWEGIVPEDSVETDGLVLKVTNQLDSEVHVAVFVECSGLLGKQAILSLGTVSLSADEEESLAVPVTDLPIQNPVGASSLNAYAWVTEAGVAAEDRGELVGTNNLFYRFDPAYDSATFFGRELLISEYGGCLSGVCTGSAEPEHVLGRVKDAEGGYVDVTLADRTETMVVGDEGSSGPDGMSIGEGDQPDDLDL